MEEQEESEILERAQSRMNRLPEQTMTAKEVCTFLGVTPTTLYRYVETGKLKKYRRMHHAYYDTKEVEKFQEDLLK